jgi:molybdopterin converting factor subunit 1
MKVSISLFAEAKQLAGKSEMELELPTDATVAVLKQHLANSNSQWADLVSKSMIAIDQQYAGPDTIVCPDSEIALIPPVSGG